MSVQLGFIQLFTFVLFVANRFLFGLYFANARKILWKSFIEPHSFNCINETFRLDLLNYVH